MQRPSIYANQSPLGTLQLSPSLSSFSHDTDFPPLLPPLHPHSCHRHPFPPWLSHLQTHPRQATPDQPPKQSLVSIGPHWPALRPACGFPCLQGHLQLTSKFRGTACQALPHGTLLPIRLTAHCSLTSPLQDAPAPRGLPGPQTHFGTPPCLPGAPISPCDHISFSLLF